MEIIEISKLPKSHNRKSVMEKRLNEVQIPNLQIHTIYIFHKILTCFSHF